ncbi:MAG: DUF2304 domain-containing protein [Clostridiales bacterium]|nr:DUF2304 domain-containing protein [Clostridiales bacterium]
MNYFFIILAIIFIIYILRMIKMKNFSIKESIFWVAGTFGILIFAIFPKLLDKIALNFKIGYPPSLLFLVAIFFLLFINFRSTQKNSKQNERIIELAEKVSILEFEIDKLNKGETNE